MKSFVYILLCSDGTFYTGVTTNLGERLQDHQTGKHFNSYTSRRLPVELVFYQEFTSIDVAISFEKKIKNWSQAKKIALINNEIEMLPNLSKKHFE